jgi:hypothetical protein
MELESVRALKAELLERIVPPIVTEALAVGRLGIAARSLATAAGPQPAIALGVAPGKRKGDFRIAVRVQRRGLAGAPIAGALSRIEGLSRGEHDTRVIGRVRKRVVPWHQRRQRPLLIGASIGHFAITAGTLGAIALHRPSGEPVLLSNNHVLADENRGAIGDDIIQPGNADGGRKRRDRVGSLLAFQRLHTGRANMIDAAVATMRNDMEFDPVTLADLGELGGARTAPVDPGEAVHKVGRTTGLTHGRITAVELDGVVVEFEIGNVSFDNQIEIESTGDGPFSAGGDSGSVIVDRRLEGIGLLFAGSDTGGRNGAGLTFANEIGRVLDTLKLELKPADFFG